MEGDQSLGEETKVGQSYPNFAYGKQMVKLMTALVKKSFNPNHFAPHLFM